MELESRDEADDALGYKCGGLGEGMSCIHLGIGELVEPSGRANDLATAD
jgi:hypothetical protein